MKQCVEQLCQELMAQPRHEFNHKWQTKQYQALMQDTPNGWVVTTFDFAENYRCDHQDQPQSAYYGYQQVTLHPVVMVYKRPCCGEQVSDNAVFTSDNLDHSSHFVNCMTKMMFDHLKTTFGSSLKKVIIFSDGCCSQYKSKIPFFYLSQLTSGPAIEHCYFGSRHGKSLCDALGDTIKTAARRAVKARQVVISSAAEMVEFCQRTLEQPVSATTDGTCVHRKRWFVELKNIKFKVKSSAALKTLPGTRKIHSLRVESTGSLASRNLSCLWFLQDRTFWLVKTSHLLITGKLFQHHRSHFPTARKGI